MSTGKRTRSSVVKIDKEEESEEKASVQKAPFRADGFSDYERERLANIQRNERFLASLGLNSVKNALSEFAAARAPLKKKAIAVKKEPAAVGPLRRSGRVTIEKLHEEIVQLEKAGNAEELALKRSELESMVTKRQEGSYQTVTETKEREWKRKDEGPLSMHEMTYDEEKYDNVQAIKDLKLLLQDLNISSKPTDQQKFSADQYTASLQKLVVLDGEVAKLTENRITSVFVHPTMDKVVVFAGDKSGNLGVWDVSKRASSNIEGVYKYEPHASNIARIDASPLAPTDVYSVSYDGTVRLFDTAKEQFALAFKAPEDLYGFYFTDANFLHDQPKCMYVSTNDACVGLVDFRASNREYQWKRECELGYRLNSVQQHPTQPNLIVTSERNAIVLYDVRKGASTGKATPTGSLKALNTLQGHTHSVNAAYISPDGHYLVSVGQEHTVRTWRNFTSPSQAADCVVTRHDNNTGRWLSTLRPTFDPKQPHSFILGSLQQPRRIEIFSPISVGDPDTIHLGVKKGVKRAMKESVDGAYELRLLINLQSEWLQSVCSRNAFHPSLNIVAGGNSSGRVHIFQERTEIKSED